jgi:superfamily II DNA/RNA helicase
VHVDAPENYKDNLYRAGSTAKAGAVRTVATLATHNQRKGMHELATIARVRINESSFSPTDANLAKVTSKAEPFGISAMTTQVGKSKHSRRTGSYRRSRSRGGGKSPDNPHMSA